MGEWVTSMDYTSDGGFILSTVTGNMPGTYELCLVKLDENGVVEWYKVYYDKESAGYCVRQTDDGGFIVVGYKYHFSFFLLFCDVWLIKTDGMGKTEKMNCYL